jgi:hypothetical protein
MVDGGWWWWWWRDWYGEAHCLAVVKDSRPEFLTRTQLPSELALGDCLL